MRAAPNPKSIEKTSVQNTTCPTRNQMLVLRADLVNFLFITPKAVTVAALCCMDIIRDEIYELRSNNRFQVGFDNPEPVSQVFS
jgi:hypothetical protein